MLQYVDRNTWHHAILASDNLTDAASHLARRSDQRMRLQGPKLRVEAQLNRAELLKTAILTPLLLTSCPPPAWCTTNDPVLAELSNRIRDNVPTQQQASLGESLGSAFGGGKSDNLVFPPWLEGEWRITSDILGVAAPLGRKFLPPDLARVRLGSISPEDGVAPLQYDVRFFRRASDQAVVSDRERNLRAVQDASAGYARVASVVFDGSATLSVKYSPFGKNGTFPGESRAEVYIQRRRQSTPTASAERFAFAEATRTVLLAQGRSVTISDAETINEFTRLDPDHIVARQRVLRFLTPNPNSAEGVLWQEARGRAVALLDYELRLERR